MEVPHRYSYNPPLRAILLFFGSGFLWIAGDWLPHMPTGAHSPTGFRFWSSLLGLIPIAVAFILGVRRICVEHYLLLDDDSMALPIGLFQMRTERIEYTSIRSIWRHYLYYGTLVLQVATEERTFTIAPSFLPDIESCDALEEFLSRKALENTDAKKPLKKLVGEESI